jgi:hypothetical protein
MTDLVKFKIPAEFVSARVRLNLSECAWGYRNGWIDREAVISLCLTKVNAGQASETEEQLGLLLRDEIERFSEIMEAVQVASGSGMAVWRYLALAWAYCNRSLIHDPLGLVEMLYADFGYPEDVAEFVRYMPVAEGVPIGEMALFSRWNEYLVRQDAFYGHRGE